MTTKQMNFKKCYAVSTSKRFFSEGIILQSQECQPWESAVWFHSMHGCGQVSYLLDPQSPHLKIESGNIYLASFY